MRRRRQHDMHITESELTAMTADLADAHHETLPGLHDSLGGWTHIEANTGDEAGVLSSMLSRRNFLVGTGVLAAGGLVATASGAAASSVARTARTGMRSAKSAPVDVQVAALAASLEQLAVSTYGAALSAAKAGKLGTVPPAIATFVTTAMAQHKDHEAAWNAIVSGAGYEPITAPNAVLGKSVDKAFAKVTTIAGVAKLALSLEEVAAATYLDAISAVTSKQAIATAATIHPVEMQHAAILNFVLGQYPVPSAYASTSGAATLSDLSGLKKKAS